MYFDEVDTPNLVEKVQNYSIKKEQVTIPDDLGLPFKSWLDIDPIPIKLSIPKQENDLNALRPPFSVVGNKRSRPDNVNSEIEKLQPDLSQKPRLSALPTEI